MKGQDDRSLVQEAIAGDRAAFGALYDRHGEYLYRLALRLVAGDEAAAEDIAHDAWVRAFARLAGFEWRAQLRTWLASFVVHSARERARRTASLVELDDDIAGDDAELENAYDRLDLQRALAALPPGYREVIVLHDIEGYTHDDIASLLGIEPGTSKSQLSHARSAMRRHLAAPTPVRN